MKNTLRLFAAFALMTIAALASCWRALTDAVETVKHAYRVSEKWAIKVLRDTLSLAAGSDTGRQPSVRLVQAKAFYFRLIRRDRPMLTDGWRLCPST